MGPRVYEREELFRLLAEHRECSEGGCEEDRGIADAILAAGYRKHLEPEITEAMVERGARAFWTAIDDNPIIDAEDYPAMRRALEAALREPLGEGEEAE